MEPAVLDLFGMRLICSPRLPLLSDLQTQLIYMFPSAALAAFATKYRLIHAISIIQLRSILVMVLSQGGLGCLPIILLLVFLCWLSACELVALQERYRRDLTVETFLLMEFTLREKYHVEETMARKKRRGRKT